MRSVADEAAAAADEAAADEDAAAVVVVVQPSVWGCLASASALRSALRAPQQRRMKTGGSIGDAALRPTRSTTA